MNYAIEMSSGALICTKFDKDWLSHSKINKGGTHTQQGYLRSLLLLFQTRESVLKITSCENCVGKLIMRVAILIIVISAKIIIIPWPTSNV
jgi:hypothetical protein